MPFSAPRNSRSNRRFGAVRDPRSYGAVYKAQEKDTGREVAIKILPAEEDLTTLKKEIEFLKLLTCDFVVGYLGCYLFEEELWVRGSDRCLRWKRAPRTMVNCVFACCGVGFCLLLARLRADHHGVLRRRVGERSVRRDAEDA